MVNAMERNKKILHKFIVKISALKVKMDSLNDVQK